MKHRAAALAAIALGAAGCASAPPPVSQTYADLLIGRTANLRNDHDIAASRYFEALSRSPGDYSLVQGALSASLAAGELDRARAAARMAPHADAPALAHIVRTIDALRASNWRRADAELRDMEGSAAEELVGRMLYVWAHVGRGAVDDVLMQLEPLASIRPYGSLFAYQQAMALDFGGRTDAALSAYQAGMDGGMFVPAAAVRHADLLARSGRRDDAIALLRTANDGRGNPELSAALSAVEANSPAVEALTPAEGAAVGLYGLGVIFMQEHDPRSGVVALNLALMLDPEFDAARVMIAEAHKNADRRELAMSALGEIDAQSLYSTTARMMEAWLLLDMGRGEDALTLARATAASGDARTMRALGDLYRSLRRYDEAEQEYTRLIESNPQDWRLFSSRGVARERQGRWPEAEADLRRALELSPDQPEVLNYLGYTLVDRGENLQEGLAMVRRAAEQRPNSGAIIDSLGWAHYKLGEFDLAQLHLERAVELSPADPTLNDHLGDVYWRLGRRIEARFQWQRALTMNPDDPAAIEAKIAEGLPPLPPTRSVRR